MINKITEIIAIIKNILQESQLANKTFENTNWLVGEKIFTMTLGVVITAIVARYFGPENFGQLNYAIAFVSLFTAFSTLGLDKLSVKAIIDKEYEEGNILCTSLLLRLFGGILLTSISITAIKFLEPYDNNLHILVFIMSIMMIFKSLEVIEYWIQAYQKAKITSIIRMCTCIIIALLKASIVIFNGNLIHLALVYVLDTVIVGVASILAYYYLREKVSPWQIDLRYAKNVLFQSWPLIFSGLMVSIYMRIDQIMLGAMMPGRKELGIYSAAVKIAEMWYFVPMALITSFTPVIMEAKKISQDRYLHFVQLLYTTVAWISIACGIFVTLFSKIIVSIVFGSQFIGAAGILTISVWAGIFAMLGTARGTWLVCEGLQKYSIIYIISGALTNIFLNYFLIPVLGGYGAAVATLITQFLVAVVVPVFFAETRISSVMMARAFKFEGIKEYFFSREKRD